MNSEGFRYDDLIRWKTAHIELADQMLGARYFRARFPDDALVTDNPDEPGTLVTKGDSIVILQQAKTRKFANPKNYLFPLPIKQMQLNSNLLDDQNPGW